MPGALAGADREAIRRAAARMAGRRLLVLHRSRARGDAKADSDWDFAFLADPGFDPDDLLAATSHTSGSPRDEERSPVHR